MSLYILSLVAGILTVLAPCVLPILPIIIGGSVVDGKKSRPWLIILSFAVSILIFTLSLQYIVTNLGVQPKSLTYVSAWILIVFGLVLLFPQIWSRIMHVTGLEKATNSAQGSASIGIWGDILLGLLLGPIFNTCSPTFAILVGNILPVSFAEGLTHILLYIAGLCAVLLAIAYGGRSIVNKLKRAADPNGWFKKVVAGLLILVGLSILQGRDKVVEIWFIEQGLVIDTTGWELDQVKNTDAMNR